MTCPRRRVLLGRDGARGARRVGWARHGRGARTWPCSAAAVGPTTVTSTPWRLRSGV